MRGDLPVGVVVTMSLSVRGVLGSIPGPIKSDTVLPTACHRCDVSSVLPRRKPAEMVPANSLHASAYYGKYI